jgi:hypothetical protein
MKPAMRRWSACTVVLALAAVMHLDWHFARPIVHHLSLGWRAHWLLALPTFGLVAWYIHRIWPAHRLAMSVAIVGTAGILAAVVEPAWEYWLADAPFEWAFGRVRLEAFGAFLAAGLVTHAIILWLLSRRSSTSRPGPTAPVAP